MEITAYKCQKCEAIFDNFDEYSLHIAEENRKEEWFKKYPNVKDEYCEFGNGRYSIQRTKEYFEQYKKDILELISVRKLSFEPFSYGWFRSLDDGGYWEYSPATTFLCICPECFNEWGQQYFRNNCSHVTKKKTIPKYIPNKTAEIEEIQNEEIRKLTKALQQCGRVAFCELSLPESRRNYKKSLRLIKNEAKETLNPERKP